VSEMRITVLASDLNVNHRQAPILVLQNVVGLKGFCKAGPPGSGIKLVARAEKRLTGYDVHINSVFFVVPVFIVKGWFGSILLGDLILQGDQFFLQLPVRGFDISGIAWPCRNRFGILAPGLFQELIPTGVEPI